MIKLIVVGSVNFVLGALLCTNSFNKKIVALENEIDRIAQACVQK